MRQGGFARRHKAVVDDKGVDPVEEPQRREEMDAAPRGVLVRKARIFADGVFVRRKACGELAELGVFDVLRKLLAHLGPVDAHERDRKVGAAPDQHDDNVRFGGNVAQKVGDGRKVVGIRKVVEQDVQRLFSVQKGFYGVRKGF